MELYLNSYCLSLFGLNVMSIMQLFADSVIGDGRKRSDLFHFKASSFQLFTRQMFEDICVSSAHICVLIYL